MGKYFTAYRIDHILGFFRIWELPAHAMTGLVGKFRPSIPLSQVHKLHAYSSKELGFDRYFLKAYGGRRTNLKLRRNEKTASDAGRVGKGGNMGF